METGSHIAFSVFANDWNLQDRLSPVGKLYDLPMVSVLDAVSPQFALKNDEGRVISKISFSMICFIRAMQAIPSWQTA